VLLPVTLLCSAQFIVVLDATIVAVALPDIRQSLGMSPEALQWVVTAYTLTFGGLLIAAGRLGDLGGRRRVFRAGLITFGAASLGGALAPSAPALVAARALQGVGAALEMPAALALITATAPDRDRAVALWTAAAAAGGASGWVLGGVLVELLGWPAIFAVNVPLCALGALLVTRVLPESRGAPRGLDVAGSAAITAALALLVLGLAQLPAALPLAGAAFVAFALIERRAADPILPARVLRRPAFVRANSVALALTATTTPAMFLAILYQQDELGRSALAAGLWCVPFNLAVIAGSALRPPGGLFAVAAGAALLVTLSPVALLVAFVVMGLGLGSASVAATAAGTRALPDDEQGIASGVLNAAAQIGTVVGVAALVPLGYTAGFAAAAVAALAAATGSRRTSRRRPTSWRR
jgi:MFS family permease